MIGDVTSLYEWADGEFTRLKENRAATKEKWERNYEAFQAIASGKFWGTGEDAPAWRSKRFINATKQKVIAAFVQVCSAEFRGGVQLPFMLKPGEMDIELPDEAVEPVVDAYGERIRNGMGRFHADRVSMRVFLSLLIYGEGYAKKRVYKVRNTRYVALSPGGGIDPATLPVEMLRFEERVEEVNVPGFSFAPVWSVYGDVEAETLDDAGMVIHARGMRPSELRSMTAESHPGLIPEAVAEVLSELQTEDGQADASLDTSELPPHLRNVSHRKSTIFYRECWGMVPRVKAALFEEHLATGAEGGATLDLDAPGDDVPCMVCLANKKVVRFLRLKTKEQPFFRVRCEEVIDTPHGTGVADNMESTQDWVNDTVRKIEDNSNLSGNTMLLAKLGGMDTSLKQVSPGLVVAVDEGVARAEDAVAQLHFPDVTAVLYKMLTLALQFADEETGITKAQQGMGDPSNDVATATEVAERTEKANQWFGQVMRNIDEGLIEPYIKWAYDFALGDPTNPLPRLPLEVQALGFSSFQNTSVRAGKLMQLLQVGVSTPEGARVLKLDEIVAELARILDADADQFVRTPKEREQLAQEQDPMTGLEIEERKARIGAANASADASRAQAMKTGAEADQAVTEATAARKVAGVQMEGLRRMLDGDGDGAAVATGTDGPGSSGAGMDAGVGTGGGS